MENGRSEKGWCLAEAILWNTHTLIAGTTGSGKSTLVKGLLWTAQGYDPSFVSFCLIDPKGVELSPWKNTRHCAGYARTAEETESLVSSLLRLVHKRFSSLKRGKTEYIGGHIYAIFDEMAVTRQTVSKECLTEIAEIMQLGRAARVHVVACTQAPSRQYGLPALLQNNFTLQIALRCRSAIESRQIIGVAGAEDLPKYGECLCADSDGMHHYLVPLTPQAWIDQRISGAKKKRLFGLF